MAYGAYLSGSIRSERLQLTLYRAANTMKSYKIFRELMTNYTRDDAEFKEALIDSSKGEAIYQRVGREKSVEGLASVSIGSILAGYRDSMANRNYIRELEAVTVDDVKRVAKQYLSGFENPEDSIMAAACGPPQVEGVVKEFKEKWKIDLEVVDDVENSFLA